MSAISSGQEETNPMNFTENQHGNSILEKLRLQRESKKFCDVIIYVEKKRFYLHRNVLSSFSPYFESLFQANKTTKEKFSITGQSVEIFQCFINYMYTGTVVLDKNNVTGMLKLAYRLDVAKLKAYCAEYLERYLNLGNCVLVKIMSDKCSMPLLSKMSVTFIKNHLTEVLNSSEVLGMDVKQLELFLSDKDLNLSQMQIIQVIINWTKQDIAKREKQLVFVLKLVRWMELDMQQINNILDNENLFVTSEISLFLMLSHLNENGLTSAKYRSVFESLSEKYSQIQIDAEIEGDTIKKLCMSKKKLRKKQKSLRANPFIRLAVLRSALVLRKKKKDVRCSEGREKGGGKSLKCHLCSHLATEPTELEEHLSTIHSRDVTYKCGVCGFVCQWNNLYIQHMREHYPGPPYKCDSCDFKSERLRAMLTHRSIHVHEKLHRCPHCSYKAKSQRSVLVHTKCHLGRCVERSGQSAKPYVCESCGFSSKFLSHLVAHKRIHSSGIYRCSYHHCKFTTGKKYQLAAHIKSHQGDRPHCCNVCGRGFLEKSHLVRHERIHLEDKPFKCSDCDYGSSRRDKLKEHLVRHHGHAPSTKTYRSRKKANHLFEENFNESSASRVHPSAAVADIQDVLVANHDIPTPGLNSYVTFTTNDAHLHHSSNSSSVGSPTMDFHHHQLLDSANTRPKEHSAPRSPPQSSAAAVAAAMMLDPRFHHNNTAPTTYSSPHASMTTMVNQSAAQVIPGGHQVPEYPTALMSLF